MTCDVANDYDISKFELAAGFVCDESYVLSYDIMLSTATRGQVSMNTCITIIPLVQPSAR